MAKEFISEYNELDCLRALASGFTSGTFGGGAGPGTDTTAVHYTTDTPTDPQQIQALTNLGGAAPTGLGGVVRRSNPVFLGTATAPNFNAASGYVAAGTSLLFAQAVYSTTAFATPAAFSATAFHGFASTVNGATLMGYGATNDVALMNRAGAVAAGVPANTTDFTVVGALNAATGTFSGAVTVNGNAILTSDAAGRLALRNGANPQGLLVYNTYTNATDYERGGIVWSGNVCYFSTGWDGSGTPRDLIISTSGAASISFRTNDAIRWTVDSAGNLTGASTHSLSVGGAVTIGGGTAIAKSATYTAAMSQSIGTLAEYEQSITATGVAAGDVVALDIPSQPAGLLCVGVRTATDAILVKFWNSTVGSLSLTGTIKARSFEV